MLFRDSLGRFCKRIIEIQEDEEVIDIIDEYKTIPRTVINENIIEERQNGLIITHTFENAELAKEHYNRNFV
jgi:hypothetical protein